MYILFFIAGVGLITFMRWQQCVKVVLILLVLEGAVRKWIFPGASQFVYFIKDFVVLVAYLKFYSLGRHRAVSLKSDATMQFLILLSSVLCVFQILNPHLGSFIVGIFGARNYLFYIPLMYLAAHLFKTQQELYDFLKWYLMLAIPVGLLGFKQHFSPPDSFWNLYAWGEEASAATFGMNVARVTGTFSYMSGYGTYLQFCASVALPLLTSKQSALWKVALISALLMIVVNTFMTGSRGPVVAFVLLLFGFLLFNKQAFMLKILQKLTIPAIVIFVVIYFFFRPQLELFSERYHELEGEMKGRITESYLTPFNFFGYVDLLGYGAGATHQASGIIRSVFNLPSGTAIPVPYESEMGRVMLELGLVGFIVWYLLRIQIIVALWRTYIRLKQSFLRQLALTAFLIHVISISGTMVFQVTFMVYYWFLAGFIFLLPRLEALEEIRWKKSIS